MNYITIGIGIAAFLYGIYTIIMRIKAPGKFEKLETMKKAWGEKTGFTIHFVGYSVIPMIAGIIFIIMGIQGKSL